jgi:hypothetical protein
MEIFNTVGTMRQRIEIGTKLRKTDSPGYFLEVTTIFTPEDGLPHARTSVRLNHHQLGERLYSISALNDPKLFTPVQGNPLQPAE